MKEPEFSPRDSLAVITQMIEEARSRYEDNGIIFLVWGVFIAIVGAAHFILNMQDREPIGGMVYFALILPGIYTGIYYSRLPNRPGNNPISRIMKWVWFAIGVNLFIIGFGFFFKLGYNLTPVILLFQGIGLLLTGSALGNRKFLGAGILTQLLGYAAFFIPPLYQPLTLFIVGLVGLTFPGYGLFIQKKRNNV